PGFTPSPGPVPPDTRTLRFGPSMPTSAPKQRQTQPSQDYVLGTGGDESVRLGLQHRLWSASTHELWERAGGQPGQTVLDIGSGPGHASLDLAQIVGPTGRVIAVDESATFLKQLHDQAVSRKQQHIERVLGDVQDLLAVLPGEEGAVDIAFARWCFCFLERPEDVVRSLGVLMKRGGKVAIQDYFNYERCLTLAPRREAFTKVISAVGASWRSRGGDTDIMARLPGMFLRSGFRL